MSVSPSRRRVLQAAALAPGAALLAACRSDRRAPARVDPDVALRQAAVAREQALLARYAALRPESPAVAAAVAAVVSDHQQHLLALSAATQEPSASPAPSPALATLPELASAERAAAAGHAADALTASAPLAQLLASLAASEASHPVALG